MQSEEAVLGAILIAPDQVNTAISLGVTEDHFGSIPNKRIWRSMKTMAMDGVKIDAITLADHMEQLGSLELAGGHSYISQLDILELAISALSKNRRRSRHRSRVT